MGERGPGQKERQKFVVVLGLVDGMVKPRLEPRKSGSVFRVRRDEAETGEEEPHFLPLGKKVGEIGVSRGSRGGHAFEEVGNDVEASGEGEEVVVSSR
jgi:hypothetical protein